MRIFFTSLCFILFIHTRAQELYPITQAASTLPKGVLGVRLMGETFDEYGTQRSQFGLRAMYGVFSDLSVYVQSGFSNHHDTLLPRNLLTHTHAPNGDPNYTTVPKAFGLEYPYLFGGVYANIKYRFFSHDGQRTHLRMAAYAEGSLGDVAHDEAEPGLDGDTKGFGAGLIITQLRHRFAATLSGGYVVPSPYHDFRLDYSLQPPDGPELYTDIHYGNAFNYNLSLGYLLYPAVYRDYKQLNVNIYVELMGKSYEAARIVRNGYDVAAVTPTLQGGCYVNIVPGIQAILNSNTRIDFSIGLDLVNRSYRYQYPFYAVGVQHYFYFNKKEAGN